MSERTGVLRSSDLAADPLEQFRRWFAEAEAGGDQGAERYGARDGGPSVRMVLLKEADERGFVFFTGYLSRKAAELAESPRAALLFFWDPLGRQVRVEGDVERVSDTESDAYFATRPRGAQLAASASRQSSVLSGREELDDRVAELAREHEGRDVPRPEHWGGFRLVPDDVRVLAAPGRPAARQAPLSPHGDGWLIERLSS